MKKKKKQTNEPLHLALPDEAYSRRYPDIFFVRKKEREKKKLGRDFYPNLK